MIAIIVILSVLFGVDLGVFLVIGLERQVERRNWEAGIRRYKRYSRVEEVIGRPQTPIQHLAAGAGATRLS